MAVLPLRVPLLGMLSALTIAGCSDGGSRNAKIQAAAFNTVAFDARVDIRVGSVATHVASADFDGDGRPDMLVTRYQESKLTILHNLGATQFDGGVDLPMGPLFPLTSTVGDLDNDGALDVVSGDFANNQLFIYRNTGTGAFSAPTWIETAAAPATSLVQDYDIDGTQDIAVSGFLAQEIRVHHGLGALAYDSGLSIPVPGMPVQLQALDFDNDQRADIMYTDLNNSELNVMQNVPSDTNSFNAEFVSCASAPAPPTIFGVASGDFDGDHVMEYVTSSLDTGSIVVWKKTANTLSPIYQMADTTASAGVIVGDFDGDGHQDVAAACYNQNTIEIWRGNGNCTFQNPVFRSTGQGPVFLTAIELDADSRTDIAVGAASSGEVSLFHGCADGPVDGPGGVFIVGQPLFVAAGDFNGDERSDLVVADNLSGEVHVFSNSGSLTFGDHQILPTFTASAYMPLVFDLDGDGRDDIVALNDEGAAIFYNNNLGGFAPGAPVAFGGGLLMGAIADLDRDGRLEFAATSPASNRVAVFHNTAGVPVLDREFACGTAPLGIATADLDRDGDIDIATACNGDNTVRIARKTPQGFKTDAAVLATNPGPAYVRAAQIEGTAQLDLVVSHTDSASILRFKNLGHCKFSAATQIDTEGAALALLVDDLNRDGRMDLFYSSRSTGRSLGLLNHGPGTFGAPATQFASQYEITNMILVDLDGDGKPELVTGGSLSGFVEIHKNLSH